MAHALPVALLVLFTIVVAPAPSAAQHDHGDPSHGRVGTVRFSNSCAPAVQDTFNRAVAMLHSFWFSFARAEFEKALAADPDCAIAYWGIALTHWGNPFGGYRPPEALEKGWRASQKGLAIGPKTERERDYISAVAELYKDAATTEAKARTLAYERAMARLAERWRDDTEAAIFYALALTQTAPPTDKTYANLKKAGALLEPLFAAQPEHPGLAHYIIHAYDVPPLAPKALEAARRYAKIAPAVPHALHMPSHTFTRLGLWDESIETNLASAEAARRDRAPTEELHAMDYQTYAYLQTARDDAARRLVTEVERIVGGLASPVSDVAAPVPAGYFAAAAIPARFALERGAWSEAAALPVRPSRFAHVTAMTHFARAVGAARSGRPADAAADLEQIAALHAKLVAAGEAYWAEQVEIQRLVASAWIAHAKGDAAEAERVLRAAADREDATEKAAVTPGPLVPAREALGELLLASGRAADALVEFERVRTKEPRRLRALYGAARAAELAGEREKARQHYAEITSVCARADNADRAELKAARAFLGKS